MTWSDVFVQFLIQVVVGFAGLFFACIHLYRVFRHK